MGKYAALQAVSAQIDVISSVRTVPHSWLSYCLKLAAMTLKNAIQMPYTSSQMQAGLFITPQPPLHTLIRLICYLRFGNHNNFQPLLRNDLIATIKPIIFCRLRRLPTQVA